MAMNDGNYVNLSGTLRPLGERGEPITVGKWQWPLSMAVGEPCQLVARVPDWWVTTGNTRRGDDATLSIASCNTTQGGMNLAVSLVDPCPKEENYRLMYIEESLKNENYKK